MWQSGSVKEIHEHGYGDNEVVYEDISEQHMSPGANLLLNQMIKMMIMHFL